MDFKDQVKAIGEQVVKMKDKILTEEATKNAFIMPFIQCLGYNVFNPLEGVPEFIANIGIKKGEKVAYTTLKDEAPIILIECKHCSADLDPHNSQLFRYFHTTRARFGLLTNGIVYRMYTDLAEPNKMDEKPFFEFRIDAIKEAQVEKLKEFHKSYFDLESIITTARELKYLPELRGLINKELSEPADEFTRYSAKAAYPSNVTPKVLEQFRRLVKRSFHQYINEAISKRLKSVLASDQHLAEELENEEAATVAVSDEFWIQTIPEELEAFIWYGPSFVPGLRLTVLRTATSSRTLVFCWTTITVNPSVAFILTTSGNTFLFLIPVKKKRWNLKTTASFMLMRRG